MSPALAREMCSPHCLQRRAYCPAVRNADHQVTPSAHILGSPLAAEPSSPQVMTSLEQHAFAYCAGRRFKDLTISAHDRALWWTDSTCCRAPCPAGWNFVGPTSQLEFCPNFLLSPSFHRHWSLMNTLYSKHHLTSSLESQPAVTLISWNYITGRRERFRMWSMLCRSMAC